MRAAREVHPHDDFGEDRSGTGVRAHLCVKSVGDPTAVTPVADVSSVEATEGFVRTRAAGPERRSMGGRP
jgi:hypothetical protein